MKCVSCSPFNRRIASLAVFLLSAAGQPLSSEIFADSFGNGANSFDIEFATIGNPGNPPDMTGFPRPAGSVSYAYRIGKYEISEQKIDKANALGGLGITKDSRGPNKPATSVSWFEAAQFVNWLNMSAGSSPAYKFDGSGNFQL
jgi:formylglycine-generating enzyme